METKEDIGTPVRLWEVSSWIYLCFFASGAAGLIYEVLWIRMLGLVFGHTVFAITTVLTAFMAGLGLGSYLFGRTADRSRNLLRLYALLEIGIGLYGLMIPFLFSSAENLYLALHRQLQLSWYGFSLVQFFLIFTILVIPTTLMGGTLPVLGKFFTREARVAGRHVGMLYALNTFGAVAGTFAAGFFLLPLIGVRATLALAVALSLGIGFFMIVLGYRFPILSAGPTMTEPPIRAIDPDRMAPARREPSARLVPLYILAGFGLSGAASLMYEVAWTRVLSLIIGSSTYAFTSMLLAFLAGLALGSWIFARYLGERRPDPLTFSLLQLGIGAGALLILPLFSRMPEVFLWAFQFSRAPGFILGVQFSISFLVMLFPTLLMGATFPCAVQILTKGIHRLGYEVGMIYGVNTAGAIIGTFSAGFLLIPTLGVQSTLKVAISINLLVAAAVVMTWRWAGGRGRTGFVALASLLGFVTLFVVPNWDKRAMSLGAAIYADRYVPFLGVARPSELEAQRVLYYRDGISSTVSVHRSGEVTSLKVNGKTDASTSLDMHTQLMMGHLPLLLRPAARDILVIGLGSGVTVGAIARHPVGKIDVVEIEPAVVQAAGYFAKENRNALADPRVRVVFTDGRNFARSSGHRYDVISSAPSNPWIRGMATLFSVEFYQLAKEGLKPSGLFCQWIQGYGLHPEDLKMVVNTFRSVFPYTTVWSTSPGDFLLIGTDRPLALDYRTLSSQFHTGGPLGEDMERLGFRAPEAILADFVLGEEDTGKYVAGARLNTDDLPLLEFSAPLSLYDHGTFGANLEALRRFRASEFPLLVNLDERIRSSAQFQYNLGMAFLAKEMAADALSKFKAAITIEPRHVASLVALGDLYLKTGQPSDAEKSYQAALKVDPRKAGGHVGLAKVYQMEKKPALAVDHLKQAIALDPHNSSHHWLLGEVYRSEGRFAEAIDSYLHAMRNQRGDARLFQALGAAYEAVGQIGDAIRVLKDALVVNPEDPMTQYELGKAYLMVKEYDRAEQAFRAAIEANPLCPGCYMQLGEIHLLRKEPRQAARAFRKALALDPSNIVAKTGLEAATGGRF